MSDQPQGSNFGPNAWLVDDMYEQYREDPTSVSESWREFFEGYRPGGANLSRPSTPETTPTEPAVAPAPAVPARPAAEGKDAAPRGRECGLRWTLL